MQVEAQAWRGYSSFPRPGAGIARCPNLSVALRVGFLGNSSALHLVGSRPLPRPPGLPARCGRSQLCLSYHRLSRQMSCAGTQGLDSAALLHPHGHHEHDALWHKLSVNRRLGPSAGPRPAPATRRRAPEHGTSCSHLQARDSPSSLESRDSFFPAGTRRLRFGSTRLPHQGTTKPSKPTGRTWKLEIALSKVRGSRTNSSTSR